MPSPSISAECGTFPHQCLIGTISTASIASAAASNLPPPRSQIASMSAFVPPTGGIGLRTTPQASAVSARSGLASLTRSVRLPSVSATPLVAPEHQLIAPGSGGGPASPGGKGNRVLLLLDFSLRVADNPALAGAAEAARGPGAALVPLASLGDSPTGAVAELAANLRTAGSGLVCVRGDVVKGVLDACKRLRLTAVYVNRAASREAARMHRRLREAGKDAGLNVVEFGALGLVEEGGETDFKKVAKSAAKVTPAPIEAPEKVRGWLKEAERVGVRCEAKAGEGTSAAMKLLAGLRKEKEMRKMKSAPEMGVQLRKFLNCGAVSEMMVARVIVDTVGKLQGATFEELVWRSYVAVTYSTKQKIPAAKAVCMA